MASSTEIAVREARRTRRFVCRFASALTAAHAPAIADALASGDEARYLRGILGAVRSSTLSKRVRHWADM